MTEIGRKFTPKEIKFVVEQQNDCIKNIGNITTRDNYILKRPELKKINEFLKQQCQNYVDTIICPRNALKLYITQSWLNYTNEKQFHHTHEHPNSAISGVLYFDADIKTDKIFFHHPTRYQQLAPAIDPQKYNLFNSSSWFFKVQTGKLVMFPSSLTHRVETKKGSNTRISLSFNTFYKGQLGINSDLTELIL
jgi:uncharacterized protein (TIGR02466 family)